MERIAGSKFDKGKKGGMEHDRRTDAERQAMKDKVMQRKREKDPSHRNLFEYIRKLLAGTMTAWRVKLKGL